MTRVGRGVGGLRRLAWLNVGLLLNNLDLVDRHVNAEFRERF